MSRVFLVFRFFLTALEITRQFLFFVFFLSWDEVGLGGTFFFLYKVLIISYMSRGLIDYILV